MPRQRQLSFSKSNIKHNSQCVLASKNSNNIFYFKNASQKRNKAESNSKCDATKHIQGTPFEWRSLVFPTSFFALSPSMTLQHRLSHLWANRIMADEQIKEDVGEEMRTSILTMLLFSVYLS